MESYEELTPYDLQVRRNIEENKKMLKSLGLLSSSEGLVQKRNQVSKKPRKTKAEKGLDKKEVQVEGYIPKRCTRRTSSILKEIGYEFDEFSENWMDEENTPPHKKIKLVREPVFGEIEGVNVGDWWNTRLECSAAGVHRPTVAGIHGKIGIGCYSIALSGGYEDDVDYGECFTYTGSGGRDLKGTKANPKNLRTGPQCKDQILDGSNAALEFNIESGKPIRVIRGYKLQSPYAPEEGYRYDGLYSVEKCWTATGVSGFKVYKFALKRLSNQDPPPWKTSSIPLSPRETLVEIVNTDVENDHIENCDNKEDITNKLNDATCDVSVDRKKQASILKYFERVEKVEENHSPKNTVNPKSLRSNRFTSASQVNLDSEDYSDFGNNVFSLKKSNHFLFEEDSVVSIVFPNSLKTPGDEKTILSSSQKRKYSKIEKNKDSVLTNELSRREPSMMENLISRTSENVKRLQNQLYSKEKKINGYLSLVKPCSVILSKTCSGWDYDDKNTFCGFNEVDKIVAERKYDLMKNVYENIKESAEGFPGWDSTSIYQGSSGLVPLGFIIDELQKIKCTNKTV